MAGIAFDVPGQRDDPHATRMAREKQDQTEYELQKLRVEYE